MEASNHSPEVREKADAELASRAVQGIWGNPGSVLLLGLTTSLPRDYPVAFTVFAAFAALIAVTRGLLLAKRTRCSPASRDRWRYLLLFNITVSAASWGVIGAFTLRNYELGSPNVMLTLVFAAAITSAGAHVMVDSVSLAFVYILVILGPLLIACLANGGPSLYLGMSIGWYILYMAGHSQRSTKYFWRGIEDNSELGRLAHHDALTGLPNRLALERSVRAASADTDNDAKSICLLYIDLDGFKQVNDRYSHRVGDLLLTVIADRLRASVERGATVCRLGGDEFCVFLAGLWTELDAQKIADRILAELRVPVWIEGIEIRPSASIGISFREGSAADLKDLLRTADQAMYLAKAVQGGGIRSSSGLGGSSFGAGLNNSILLETRTVPRSPTA